MDEELICQLPLFAALPREELDKLKASLRLVELAGGDVLFSEGEPGDCFYIVLSGQLEVAKAVATKEERILNRFGPRDDFGRLLQRRPGIAFHIAKVLSDLIRSELRSAMSPTRGCPRPCSWP